MAAYKIYSKTSFDLTNNNNAILQLVRVSHIEYSQEHNIARCLGILGKIKHSCNLSKKKIVWLCTNKYNSDFSAY